MGPESKTIPVDTKQNWKVVQIRDCFYKKPTRQKSELKRKKVRKKTKKKKKKETNNKKTNNNNNKNFRVNKNYYK